MNLEYAKDSAQGFFQGASLVSRLMQAVNSSLVGTMVNPSRRDECMEGMFHRAIAWMRTLEKLNGPTDFQAIVCGNRALLEITTDMVLLHKDASDASWWKMVNWEESSKLKSAEALQRYYSRLGKQVPDEYHEQVQFVLRNKQMIERMRMTLWPNWNGKHPPNRWTGEKTLLEDIKVADDYWGRAIKDDFGVTLEEFYETENRRVNWNVHGSALTGVRHIDASGFHTICALTFKRCADLAMVCTKVILTDYGFATHLPELERKWENLRESRLLAYGNSVGFLSEEVRDQDSEDVGDHE